MWHRALNRNVCLCDIAPAPPSTILVSFKKLKPSEHNDQSTVWSAMAVPLLPPSACCTFRWHKYRTHWWWHTPASCAVNWALSDHGRNTIFKSFVNVIRCPHQHFIAECVFLKWFKHENPFLSEGPRQRDACDRSFFNYHVILTFSGCQEPWSVAFPRTWDYINRPRKNFPNWAPLAKKLARRVVDFNSLIVLRVPSFHGNLYWLRRQSMCSIGAWRFILS